MKPSRRRSMALPATLSGLAASLSIVLVGCTIERADVRTPSGEPPESDTIRVHAVIERFANALAGGDTLALDTLLAGDLTVFANGRAQRGRRALLEAGLTSGRGSERLLLSDVTIAIAAGEMALATCEYRLRSSGDEPGRTEEGLVTLILRRSAAGWQLTHVHVSTRVSRAPPQGEGDGGEAR